MVCFFFSSRRRHTRWNCDWSSDVCSSDLPPPASPEENLRTDIEVLGSVARRVHRRLRQGALQNLLEREREELARSLRQSLEETRCMAERFEQEMGHAGPEHASGDSQAA